MLLPSGVEVAFSKNGDIQIDEEGCVLVREKELANNGGEAGEGGAGGRATSGVREPLLPADSSIASAGQLLPAEAMELASRFPSPPSWSTFGVPLAPEDDQVRRKEQDDLQESGAGLDHGQTPAPTMTSTKRPSPEQEGSDDATCIAAKASGPSSGSTDPRPLTGHFVYGSGVFLALKTQDARSAKQLALLVKEVENLRFLSGEQGVVQIIDHAVCYKFLKLNILMELGVGSFFG